MANKPGAGRPKKEIDYEQVERLAGVGFSKRQIATVLDMNEEYMITLANKDEKLSKALSGAKDRLHGRLTGEIVQYALDKTIPYPQRRKDITFLLARRFGWTERVQIENNAPQLPDGVDFQQSDDIEKDG